MGVELGMRVLELEGEMPILALAPQGTAGIHGCDTRGCTTQLCCTGNLHCAVGWGRKERGWRRNGEGDSEEVEKG